MSGWATWAALAGPAIGLAGPVLARLGAPPLAAMITSVLGALVGVVGALALVRAGGPGSLAIVGAVPFAFFLIFWWGHRQFPLMNDIVTDPDAPLEFTAAGALPPNSKRNLAYRAENAAMQREHYPKVVPFRTKAVPDAVFKIARQVADDLDWTVHHVDEGERRYEAVAITGQFRFRDDVAVQVVAVDGGSVVHARAKARDGRGDFGANAARVQDFLAAVKVRLPAELAIED